MSEGRDFFTLREAAAAAGAGYYPERMADFPLPRVFRTDGRIVENGGGFIAIKGTSADGGDYIAQAVQNGARCVFLERSFFERNQERLSSLDAAFILADDVSASVVKLAGIWLDAVSPRVVGITGSVGKTTTREFLNASLRGKFKTHAAIKSYNTLIGVSMTILAAPRGTEILILELGTNHPGEIREIVNNFPVTDGIITEVTDAHLEGLRNIEGVLAAKMEICESRKLEYLSYNSDNELLSSAVANMPGGEKMKKNGIKQIGIGYANSGVRISDVRQAIGRDFTPELFVTLSMKERKVSCHSRIFGRQHAKNIAFAYSEAVQAGLADGDFESAAADFALPPGRGVIKMGKNGCALIDETYNANPASVSSAVKNLLEMDIPAGFKRVGILGGMKELGAESARLHEITLNRAALLDEVYLIGSEWGGILSKADFARGVWSSSDSFMEDFDFASAKDSVFLLKGSRYYALERILPMFGNE